MAIDTDFQIDVIVEARIRSSRLPGKVLLPAVGKPLLGLMVERLKRIEQVDNIIIATTVNDPDDRIADLADDLGVVCFRGDEDDVLGRVVKAAQKFGTEIIVEITGDNPLVDPILSGDVINAYLDHESEIDFAANDLGCYRNDVEVMIPLGFNTKVFSRELLELVEAETNHPIDREHVVNYIVKRDNKFRLLDVKAEGIYHRPDLRFTLDTQEDYRVIKAVFEDLYFKNPNFDAKEIIGFLDANPQLRDINKHIVQRKYEYD